MKIAKAMRESGLYRYNFNEDNVYKYDYVNMEKGMSSGIDILKKVYIYYIKKLYENS